MPNALSFRVLQVVALHERTLQSNTDGVRAADIASDLGCSWQYIDKTIHELVSPLWDRRRPWLIRQLRGGVRLSEQGWLTLAGLDKAPYAVPEAARAMDWINRHRWPWRENDSRERAVVPMGGI